MKLSIEQHQLQSILARVTGAVSKRNTIPILGNVKLSATECHLTAVATDLDLEVTARQPASIATQGATTANAVLLQGIINKLPKGALVSLEHKDDYLHITAGKSKFKLATLPAEDFPQMASNEYQSRIVFEGIGLKNAFSKTAWAASTETTRYYLNGVAMQHMEGKANFISTDGHRLAWFNCDCENKFENVIIPNEAVKHFISTLDFGDATLEISETKVRLTHNDVIIVSKVIDGTFPEWSRVLPSNTPNRVTVPSVSAKEAIERVSLVASEKTKIVKLSISESEIELYVRNNTSSDATEIISAVQIGAEAEIGLNGRYALDAFAQADKGDVTIHYGGGMDTMKVTYDKEEGLTVVVMPVRV